MCNQTPTCGGGSQFNGNTMVCGQTKPNYGGFGGMGNYGGNYGYGYNYGNQMQTYAQPQVAQQVATEKPQAEAEEEDWKVTSKWMKICVSFFILMCSTFMEYK